ncbi:MAG: tol-pal system protein YbgF [Deltaproteobacteria bacterium]|nr:tol-pal system protein YbgF [Deltaproteobacteria bacterium]
MTMRKYILLALVPAFVAGCAGTQKKDEAFQRLTAQIDGLRVSLEGSRARFDELDNKFYLLQEKVEASKQDIEKMVSLPEDPPEGLKVVSLTEHGHEGQSSRAEGAVKKAAPAAPQAPARPAAGEIRKTSLNKKAETPDEMYSRGQDLFLSGRYEEARGVFLSLAGKYPGHTLADNAIYWAGEAYYTEKDFANALLRFAEAAEKYPAENKAPDALLKAGFSCMEVNDNGKAREYLVRLVTGYPDSEAAGKARKVLPGLSEN